MVWKCDWIDVQFCLISVTFQSPFSWLNGGGSSCEYYITPSLFETNIFPNMCGFILETFLKINANIVLILIFNAC